MPKRICADRAPRLACIAASVIGGLLLAPTELLAQQRVLGIDISYWNRGSSSATSDGITQAAWNTAYNTPNANGYTRQFAFIRATRGGTTGLSTGSGTYNNPPAQETLSARYDDPDFLRNMTRAANSGMFAGPYHYGRPDVAGNTGADEADHFIELASAYMRPGYLMPVFDLEDGSGGDALAQFAIDFSDRLFARMHIRPAIYINGNYSSILQGASQARRNQLAQPVGNSPSVIGPAYPMLWNARYSDNSNPEAIPVQTGSPKTTYTTLSSYYGPWDDYGNSDPWSFWQYSSTVSVPGITSIDSTIDGNVAHGDIEYVKNYLVPAVWWNDSSGDWSTMANWNSGRSLSTFNANDLNNPPAPYTPRYGTGQVGPSSGWVLPVPRLPGTAGSGPASTSGIHDTVILERPNANITVTLSSGTYNIRKLYMRETLNITGGSLTINYDPAYRPDNSATVLHGGPVSAQFSGAVTLSGAGSLTVNTLQVDAAQTFTLAGSSGTLTFKQINLMPHSSSPAKISVTGNVNISPLSNSTAIISNGSGTGSTGFVDLGGGTRSITVGNGSAAVDLDVAVPITNGNLTKAGAGTLQLSGSNSFTAVTINAGTLQTNHVSALSNSTAVTVNNGGTLDLNGISETVASLASAAGNTTGAVLQGPANLTLSTSSGTFTYGGTITGAGTLTKSGASTQILSGNNSLGPVTISAGSLLFNGANTTGNITVGANGVLGGTGSVSGSVTLNNLGRLTPGASVESFGVGALTLNVGSILDFEIGVGGVMDRIDVTGLLTIVGSTVNIIDAGGLSAGLYTIIDYGTKSGSVTNLGTPNGPNTLKYGLVDTGSEIQLRVSIHGDFNFDNRVDAADYVVWRKGLGTVYTLADYNLWRNNFGSVAGSGTSFGDGAPVPEPGFAMMLLTAAFPLLARRRRAQ